MSVKQIEQKEQGQSLVEMALSFLILMLMFSAMVDLGRAFFTYISLTDAAQEGGSYAAMDPTNETEIISRVHQTTNAPVDLTGATVVVAGSTCAGFTSGLSNSIKVTVTYTLQFISPFANTLLPGGQLVMGASSTNTIIRPQC